MGQSTSIEYNPETWCDDAKDEDITKHPIKILACLAAEIIELMTPFFKYIKIQIEIVTELILNNKFIIELLIIVGPIMPLIYLFMYFFDTL